MTPPEPERGTAPDPARFSAKRAITSNPSAGQRMLVAGLGQLAGNAAVARLLSTIVPPAPSPARATFQRSRALMMRDTSPGMVVQRDISGHKDMKNGSFAINFKKRESATDAGEDGRVRFHPYIDSPESKEIKFVQIVKTDDTSDIDNAMITKASKDVRPGFFVDHIADDLSKTAKAGGTVRPYYDVSGPPILGNQTGRRVGKERRSAVLADGPGHPAPQKFEFETAAKAVDTGFWYGTVRWGFEVFASGGKMKVRDEHHSFEEGHSATTDAALNQFQDFYKGQGATVLPGDRETP